MSDERRGCSHATGAAGVVQNWSTGRTIKCAFCYKDSGRLIADVFAVGVLGKRPIQPLPPGWVVYLETKSFPLGEVTFRCFCRDDCASAWRAGRGAPTRLWRWLTGRRG